MFDRFKKIMTDISRILSTAAEWAIFASMALVVVNVLLSNIFKIQVFGTIEYEYIGFLAAVAIGFGLAFCAVNGAHIAITVLTDKLSIRANRVIDLFNCLFSLLVMSVFTSEFIQYIRKLMISGEVSPTTRTPYYIFVALVGGGFLVYCLVLVVKLGESVKSMSRGNENQNDAAGRKVAE
jgi:TRAP-type C4-dicarboxylate transport system permease small subunit